MKRFIKYISALILAITLTECTDLDVENINDPSTEFVLSNPEGIRSLTGSLFNNWFFSEQHNLYSPGPAMWVMADWGTVTFANYGTLDMSAEPRIALNNTPAYTYHQNYRNYWRNMYGVITSANNVVRVIDGGMQIGTDGRETMMVKGMGYFMQGLGNGYIGLVFDKGYPSDENTDYGILTESGYSESINMAIHQLEKAIEVFDNNDFVLPAEWINGNSFTNKDMSILAHSFIARLMVYAPRNVSETNSVDWQKVLQHSQLGITDDFYIMGDGDITDRKWMSWYKYYMARPTWGKVDMRVVHMLDNTQPEHWPDAGFTALPNGGHLVSADARALTDYQFNDYNIRPERGLYRWSSIRYARLDSYFNSNFFAPVIMMRKAENDLFVAEAYARLSQYGQAKDIINAGTRVTRGNLPEVSDDPTEIMNAIFYERTIELPLTGMGIEFFDMRRRDLSQDGSLLHFPVPAQQLEIMQLPFYTFGGIDPQFGIPGIDVAINGWYH